jgi:hypothetical protein
MATTKFKNERRKEIMDNKTTFNGELPRYCVINPDGTYAGVFCLSPEEASEMAIQIPGRVVYRLTEIGHSEEAGMIWN